MTMYYVFYFFLYLVPLCIFRVLLKKEKKTTKTILEWMQICNCAFLYLLVWLHVGLEWCINNSVDMLTKVDDGVAFKDWNTFAYLRWNPMMSKGFLEDDQSNVSEPVGLMLKWLLFIGFNYLVEISIPSLVHNRMSTGTFKSCLLVEIIMI